jgi:hypothetical protein
VLLTEGLSAAGRSPIQPHTDDTDGTLYAAQVSNILSFVQDARSVDIPVRLEIKAGSLTDRAGNTSPLSADPGRSLTVTATVTNERRAGELVVDTVASGGLPLSYVIAILVSAAVLLGLAGAACLLYRRRQREHTAAELQFQAYGQRIFQSYGKMTKVGAAVGLTRETIVEYGVENGYPVQRSEKGADRLLQAADKDRDGVLLSNHILAFSPKTPHPIPPHLHTRTRTHHDKTQVKKQAMR